MREAKSHARNSSYFIERVMRLPRPRLREWSNTKMISTTAAASSAAPTASALLRLRPVFSGGGARAFVCVSASFSDLAFVGLAFVERDNAWTGGGCDSTLAGGGLLSSVVGGVSGIKLVPTFVPIITSGGALITGGKDAGGGGGGLVLIGATG